jgi:hypothetical protein
MRLHTSSPDLEIQHRSAEVNGISVHYVEVRTGPAGRSPARPPRNVVPTRILFERMNAEVARGHRFFIFNNVPDLPEALIAGEEELWLPFIFSTWCYNPELFTPDEIAVYV